MTNVIDRFNEVAMTKMVPMETFENKSYPLIMVSSENTSSVARVILSRILGE
jgi:hypothetical protein